MRVGVYAYTTHNFKTQTKATFGYDMDLGKIQTKILAIQTKNSFCLDCRQWVGL
jgi:hypothetical protein